jgi:hypothetical protein
MVSSEVQRTLVKSPPELWAEISDPASLARHLGEFGEIRITRVEPEQRVEWEAGDTSGSVVIKPSGWGTKVKLTVNREHAQQEHSDPAVARPEGPQPAVARPEGPEPEQAEPELARPEDQEPAVAGLTPARPGLTWPEDTAPEDTEPDGAPPENADSDMAHREDAKGEDALRPEAGADEPAASVFVPAGESAPEADAECGAEDEAEQPPAPQPRRGFLARLFGRRGPARADAPADTEAEADDEGPDVRERALEAPAHERYNALAVWASQIEPDAPGDDAWEPQDAAEAPNEPSGAPAGMSDLSYASDAHVHAPGADLGESLKGASPDGQAPGGISAELTAAEEVAAERVTAVLTGVLDRLGAAHHRPFSRS